MLALRQQFSKLINGTSQRNKHKKSKILIFWQHVNIKKFHSNLLKTDKKSHENIDITILVTSQLKSLLIMKIFTA